MTISNPSSSLQVGIAVDTAYIMDDDSTAGVESLNAFDVRVFSNPVGPDFRITANEQMNS